MGKKIMPLYETGPRLILDRCVAGSVTAHDLRFPERQTWSVKDGNVGVPMLS